MWFKNLTVFRMPAHWSISTDDLTTALGSNLALPLGSQQAIGHGWEPVYEDVLVHSNGNQKLLSLRTDKKVVPTSAVKASVKEAVEIVTAQTGRKPGRKELKEIKESALMALLPNALVTTAHTKVWIDQANGWIVVDTPSANRGSVVISQLIRCLEKLSLETLWLAKDAGTAMTHWLSEEDGVLCNFTIDDACELKAPDESKAVVRYTRSNLDNDDLRQHIKQGKRCVKLALTWESRISFVLTSDFKIRQIKPLEIITNDVSKAGDERELFESDFVLMTAELNALLSALVEALGGEKPRSELF